MTKNFSLILAIILAGFLAVHLNDPWRNITPSELYTAIISTDGALVPGSRQDFLVNVFKDLDGQRTFESKINLGIKLEFPLVDGSKKEQILPLTTSFAGKYTCSCSIPENTDYKDITVTLFPDARTDKPIMSCQIPVKKERAIIIKPPQKPVYTGEKISFELASIDKKTGFPLIKIPVRVKLIAPCGITTLNRVISTDTEGMGLFQTRIHAASPEGYYTFIFQSGNFEQKITVYVRNSKKTENLLLSSTIPVYLPEQETNETSGFIYNLNCQHQDALLAYGCPDSEHRQIEIWQNGKLHYFANLDLEGGTISLILQKPLLAGCPALFKIWQISNNQVVSHEKIRYIEPHTKNKFNQFLIDLNSEFQNTEKDKLASALARKGIIGISNKLSASNLTVVQTQNLKSITPFASNDVPLTYYEELLKENIASPSFEIVDVIKQLPKSDISYIYLDSKSFLENYIKHLQKSPASLDILLQETICRINLIKNHEIPQKANEIEEIEGLLIPLSEIYSYLQNFNDLKKIHAHNILSTINILKDVTFVPAEFLFDCSQGSYKLDSIPMLNMLPNDRILQSMQGLFKEGGTVSVSDGISTETIELNKPLIVLPSNTSLIKNERGLPIVVSY